MPIEARLEWSSQVATHVDRLILPDSALLASGRWAEAGRRLQAGETVVALDALPWCQPAGLSLAQVPLAHFRLRDAPVPGRCYPRMAFSDLAQGPRDLQPVRLLEVTEGHCRVDPNHPLAACQPQLTLAATAMMPAPGQRMAELFDGPGLQVPPQTSAMAYFGPGALERQDDGEDARFYAEPRFVQHLDGACRGAIRALYGRFLAPGSRVLDLMASWDSHLPEALADLFVAGLGMNGAELEANERLSERVVKDLNQRAGLPWGDAQFDGVVCTASIEYLLRPGAVLAEVRRVLRPGGICLVTFSDRWFPTKAIQVWSQLHPFERSALVLSLFREAGFTDLHTESLRGLARPEDDKYSDQRRCADPLFAIWGQA
ncbi:MAG: methyltransferase domain-containing protein [Pseudomonadota bacterium]